MGFVHDQDEVFLGREIVEIAAPISSLKLRMRGLRPPRTSELILEMLKMLIVTGNRLPPLAICRSKLSPVVMTGGEIANSAMPFRTYFGVFG